MNKKLLNKNFFLLWQGQLISQLGDQAFIIAMNFWIMKETNSASLVGTIMMLSTLPSVILGPFAGTFADWHSRKKIMVISDFINGLIVLAMGAAIYFKTFNTHNLLILLFIVSTFVAIINAFFRPAVTASIPELVPQEKLEAANSMNESTVQFASFLGQGAGGLLYKFFGPAFLFIGDGITYLFSSFSEIFIDIPQKIEKKNHDSVKALITHFTNDMKEGFQYIYKKNGMRNLFLIAAVLNFFLMPIIVLLPFFVKDFLHQGADWYGYIMGSFGAGALLGYFLVSIIKFSAKMRSLCIVSLIVLNSTIVALLGLVKVPIIALLMMFFAGIMNGFININIMTAIQVSTDNNIRGRVFGLLQTMSMGITPISMGLSGIIADLLNQNIPLIYIISGGIAAILSFLVALNKDTREFLAF
jgi:DHA3 family macrolide efflux protein-like MFS transporter